MAESTHTAPMGEYRVHDATLSLSVAHPKRDQHPWEIFNRTLDVLAARGFTVEPSGRVGARYPSIAKYYRSISRVTPHGLLEGEAQIYPVGIGIEFFQDVVATNPNGGKYDFDRVSKMPYLIRKRFEGALTAVAAHLREQGFADGSRTARATPAITLGHRLLWCESGERLAEAACSAAALAYFNQIWGGTRFARDESGWPAASELRWWRPVDRDGQPIWHGQIRWARSPQGYWRRGRVYGGINGMWLFVFGPGPRDVTQTSAHELHGYPSGRRKAHPRPRDLATVLAQEVKAQNFERAIVLRDLLRRQTKEAA
ncbi:hypothetical protein [Phenylobacterium sp.]|uniref:hypothetical protein n=1 Tax=Phenylobacterium sp. TaxID=1871053 RepID=UPI0040355743